MDRSVRLDRNIDGCASSGQRRFGSQRGQFNGSDSFNPWTVGGNQQWDKDLR